MTSIRYMGPFAFLLAIPILYRASEIAPLAVPFSLVMVLLALRAFQPDRQGDTEARASRLLPILYIPLHLAVLLWAVDKASTEQASASMFFTLAFTVGVCGGVFGVLSAHEMIHGTNRWHRVLGALMLTGISYRHHRVAHVYGHHRYAASSRDPATAQLGESFYAFLPRTLVAQFIDSWCFEQRRTAAITAGLLRNRVLQDGVITLALYVVSALAFGWRAPVFMALQSTIAILVLELFNYVAHYGMHREPGEPMRDCHSWNSSGAENYLLFNMGRHSHHHRAPTRRFHALQAADAPELPGGYAGAILLALVPPFWRRVMDRRLRNEGRLPVQMRLGAAPNPLPACQ